MTEYASYERRNKAYGASKKYRLSHRNICVNCGGTYKIVAHHIQAISDGGSDNDSNLVILCERCHALAHGYKTLNGKPIIN